MSSGRSYGTYTPYLPARKPTSPTSTAITASIPTPSHSPPRKVVTDFAAFGASKAESVFSTAVAPMPFSLAGTKAAFGPPRFDRGMTGDDDDDDDDDYNAELVNPGRQKVELLEDTITLEQARRIAMQSAWRSARV